MDVVAICLITWVATILILSSNDDDDDDHFDGGYHIHVYPRNGEAVIFGDYEKSYGV